MQPIISYPELAAAFTETVIKDVPRRLDDEQATPLQKAAFLAALGEAMRQLEQDTEEADPDVMVVPRNRLASLMLSSLAEDPPEGSTLNPLAAGGAELKFAKNDVWGWLKSLFQRQAEDSSHPFLRPTTDESESLPNRARIALVADWGTGLYGATEIPRTLEADTEEYSLLMHLGDVYYSGTRKEIQTRFLDLWPQRPEAVSRALNSNHEMYSGGHGYFGMTLPAFDQASSYFAMANDHWLLIGLDTGYVDHAIDDEQAAWVHRVCERHGGQRVLLFSHHQLFSHHESNGEQLAEKLAPLLASGRVAAWYWGHEHRCILYDPDPRFGGLAARCLGHGGMPYGRKKVKDLPVVETVGDSSWRRLKPANLLPGAVALDGPNPFISGKEDKYGPHGYLTLELDDDRLRETVRSAMGDVLWDRELS